VAAGRVPVLDVHRTDTTQGGVLVGFKGIQAVAGLYDDEAHEGAKNIACWADALGIKDPWWLLEACGLVPYEAARPPRTGGGRKSPRTGGGR
jgi:hypothetical protein